MSSVLCIHTEMRVNSTIRDQLKDAFDVIKALENKIKIEILKSMSG